MSDRRPDFFLASSEGYNLTEPRGCWRIKRLSAPKRNDLLLVKVNPPLDGQKYGKGDQGIDRLILATRHQGASLFPITEWPVFVHVARSLVENPQERDRLNDDEFESIAWAELYRSEENARRKAM